MQLVAYGAQDIYLTGNPQITFFKVVYRRHTNFSMESIEQTLQGNPTPGGSTVATISRNGDLVGHLYVQFNPSKLAHTITATSCGVVPNLGHALLKETEVEIGGQRIDRQYSHWLNTWGTLTGQLGFSKTDADGKVRVSPAYVIPTALPTSAETHEVVTPPTLYQKMAYCLKDGSTNAAANDRVKEKFATVPLQFWFCRNPGLALPLIALQYHEVKVKLTFPTTTEVFTNPGSHVMDLSSVQLWADYIYLDTDERRRFAQVSHEYLIEQLQYQSETPAKVFTLNFNHPVKELVWAGQRDPGSTSIHGGPSTLTQLYDDSGNKTRESDDVNVTLKLNGHERFAPRHDMYFSRTQVWQHHARDRGQGGDDIQGDSIHVYSFALKPEEHQPSGTCNFSRIDSAQLIYDKKVGGDWKGGTENVLKAGLHIYAVNYNVLRIMSGMGGLAYSN
jgi:hypothetical protein